MENARLFNKLVIAQDDLALDLRRSGSTISEALFKHLFILVDAYACKHLCALCVQELELEEAGRELPDGGAGT